MDIFDDIAEKIFNTADIITRKTSYLIDIGEYKMNILILKKEIEKRKIRIGEIIYERYLDKDVNLKEVTKLCKEIKEIEDDIENIYVEMENFKK